jgi:hypothetical protein
MASSLFSRFLFLVSPTCASFVALGPPAAPRAQNLGSANRFSEADLGLFLRHNHSRNSAVSNSTTFSVALSDDANHTVSDGIRQNYINGGPGHFWLSDPGYSHKVCLFLLLAFTNELTPYQMPLAGDGYQVFRNVQNYGATGNGRTDDYAAIQAAITDGNRCGANCNATSVTGAIIYFPPGTYAISQPIVQYYYTVFVGDPTSRPKIKPLPNFQGIALIDTDFYIDGGNGANW